MEDEVNRQPIAADLHQAQQRPMMLAARIATGTVIPIKTHALCQGG